MSENATATRRAAMAKAMRTAHDEMMTRPAWDAAAYWAALVQAADEAAERQLQENEPNGKEQQQE